jgi:lipid A 3-O-deacylase
MSVLPIIIATASGLLFAVPMSDSNSNGLPTDPTPTIVLGAGMFDMNENDGQDKALDLRAEYRGSPFFYVFKPLVGFEVTGDGGGGVFAGVAGDWLIHDHFTFTPSFAVGAWGSGDGKDMGSVIEFRSQVEVGYKFDNGWRVSAAYSHISNAEISNTNPGAEIGTFYLHIPADKVLPR